MKAVGRDGWQFFRFARLWLLFSVFPYPVILLILTGTGTINIFAIGTPGMGATFGHIAGGFIVWSLFSLYFIGMKALGETRRLTAVINQGQEFMATTEDELIASTPASAKLKSWKTLGILMLTAENLYFVRYRDPNQYRGLKTDPFIIHRKNNLSSVKFSLNLIGAVRFVDDHALAAIIDIGFLFQGAIQISFEENDYRFTIGNPAGFHQKLTDLWGKAKSRDEQDRSGPV